MKLANKVAIITGSSRGIGRNIAVEMAKEGATIVVAARSEVENERLPGTIYSIAEKLRSTYGVKTLPVRCDVTRDDEVEEMVQKVVAEFGRIDVLVNNAGIRVRKPFGEFSGADFDLGVAVNLRAPFMLSQAVLPAMRKQGGGRIIHVASQLGSVATPGSALYGLSKAALIHLTKSMALELGREGIMVNAVSPGPTETEYMRARWQKEPGIREKRMAEIPLGRYGRPEEIAQAVLFLAATDAAFIQGHDLVIDGGYNLH